MKKFIFITSIFLMFFLIGFSQITTGPVLKKELVGKYGGDQKKGLAQGKGTATGTDSYVGEFKAGLPDGVGVYTDSQGNVFKGTFHFGLKDGKGEFIPAANSNDKPLTGYWMDDKYVGKDKVEPYEVSSKVGSVSPRIYSTGPGNVIDITVVDPTDNSNVAATINLIGIASPREDTSYHKYFFEDCKFPIEFDIRYQVRAKSGGIGAGTMYDNKDQNKADPLRPANGGINANTALADNSIHIKIIKPGKWTITLKN